MKSARLILRVRFDELDLQRAADEEAIKLRLPAGEMLDDMNPHQLLDAERLRHGLLLEPKTEGSRNSRST
jgi:hypothetical protein